MAAYKSQIDGWIIKIQNPERMERQRALKELLEFCQTEENVSDSNAVEIFDSVYLCLIKCYGDKFEMCRSLACSIVSEILKPLEKNDYYLSLLVPVIAKRLANHDIVEESEEMRLQLLEQLNYIISKYKSLNKTGTIKGLPDGDDPLLKPYNDIVDILKCSLLDTYPAILRKSCEVIKATADASPSFHFRCEALVEPLIFLLKHRHSAIRIATIEALGIVALNIRSNGDAIKQIIKELSPMVMDLVPNVRRECGKVGCSFLLALRDRYSYFERILPMVLTCLSEDVPEVKAEIKKLWIEAGAQYYLENQNELQSLNQIDELPLNYPDFLERPTIGCRALVRRSLQVLNAVLHEMEDWKEDVRLHSTKLLMQIVIHSEDHLSTKYYDINAVLCKTCSDPEPVVAKYAIEIAKLIGHFVDAKTWSKYILDEMKVRQNKLGVFKCLNAIFSKSTDSTRFDCLEEISEALLDSAICHNNFESFQTELMTLVEALLPGIPKDSEEVARNLYIVVLKSTAVSYDNDAVKTIGLKILRQIADVKCIEVNELHKKFLKPCLETLDLLDQPNDDSFEQVLILYGIICICGFQKPLINDLKRVINIALEHCQAEGKIKIFSGIAMASLNWNQTIGVEDPNENFLMLASFVGEIIAPHLIWHAGQTAESSRTMATAALCSLAQGTTSENAGKIVESLIVPLVSLIDDHNIATRLYALRLLYHVGALQCDQLKTLAPALLTRLDDSGNEVRERAAKCLGKLQLANEDAAELWEPLLKQILATMLIHLESPEVNLRESLIDSITNLSKRHPEVYRSALEETTISRDLKCKLPQI